MLAWFAGLSPLLQVLLATTYTWLMTAVGAGTVFFLRGINEKIISLMLGFAAGVMIAASYWSLLAPAISLAAGSGVPTWLPVSVGFLLGGAFLWGVDRLIPHLHMGADEPEGPKTNLRRSFLLVLAVTLHNIPEGLAVGVVFGVLGTGSDTGTLAGAMALALGMGIQNLPEGMAVAGPLRQDGLSRWKSFWYGQISGLVEIVFGVVGLLAVTFVTPLLPYALSFAAGAMIYVVVEELIPEAQDKSNHMATLGTMLGFTLMMVLDVALS